MKKMIILILLSFSLSGCYTIGYTAGKATNIYLDTVTPIP